MSDKLGIAQIGCGYWGPNLLRNFSALKNCAVKYVVEASPERREFVADNFPRTQPIANLQPALEDGQVRAVIVATPAATHYEIAKQALENGRHVFVEKPLAMSVAHADELIALAAERKLTLMAGHTFLYNGAVQYLKKLVTAGELGRLFYMYSQRLNLGVIRSDVNAMWNLAPHDVSILMHVAGQIPVAVSARGRDYIQPGVEDVVFMHLEFADGVQASVQVSWLDPNKVRKTTLVGDKKMVVYDDVADDKIVIYDKGIDRFGPDVTFDNPAPHKLVHRAGDIHLPKIDFKEPLKVEASHFVDCVLSGKEPVSGPANARAVVAVLEAAQKSLRNGGATVRVD